MNWSDVLKAVIPIVVMSLAWLLGQVNSFSERLTKIEGSMPALAPAAGESQQPGSLAPEETPLGTDGCPGIATRH